MEREAKDECCFSPAPTVDLVKTRRVKWETFDDGCRHWCSWHILSLALLFAAKRSVDNGWQFTCARCSSRAEKRGGNGKENPATCLIAIQRKYFSTFLRSRKVPADCASIYRCNFLFVGRLRPSGRGSFEARIYLFFLKISEEWAIQSWTCSHWLDGAQ